ncbi:RNA polymerase sigma factor [uncultured Maricaulis sp.]|uniref:RNA polymerase sigma factor n=1 Tax=uncultured Maricaulis sp. TaxID=174710 RepID=UPI0030DDDAA1|tara:strand:+ start:170750 stop:171289 length:540 start_codon:yes stop_codon:yes gene_type:complete
MSTQMTDAALVGAARSGSDTAFAKIVDRHQQAVRSFLRRVCGHEADADDLAQETFLAAWTALRTLDEPDRIRSWLFGIAWRQAKGMARSMSRTRRRETDWQAERPEHDQPGTELNIAMQQALAQLPADQRAAIALCLAGDWSHGDAAKILEMPLGTVKSHVLRGRARLVEILGVRDDEH